MVVLWGHAGVSALAENLDAKAEPLPENITRSGCWAEIGAGRVLTEFISWGIFLTLGEGNLESVEMSCDR
jgi:hypothetical protein